MNIKIVTAITALCIAISSCSSKPEIGDIEQTLNKQISHESSGRIELVNLEKTDAIEKEYFGQKVYTISYKAKIRFEEDCFMYVNKSGVGPFIESFRTYLEEPEFVPSMQMQIVSCEKGQEVEYANAASFNETDEGWVSSK